MALAAVAVKAIEDAGSVDISDDAILLAMDGERAANAKSWRICATHSTVNQVAQEQAMKEVQITAIAFVAVVLTVLGGMAFAQQDKYALKVPGGLAFSEFRGYEGWQVVATSQNASLKLIAVILANPEMIEAYQAGIPSNGKPFPDGAKMAKIHWNPKMNQHFPSSTVSGTLHDVAFMVKDSKRFADSGGWGWAAFNYDAASDTFTPATEADKPPQANDAKCGFACHTVVKARDYVFTEYGRR